MASNVDSSSNLESSSVTISTTTQASPLITQSSPIHEHTRPADKDEPERDPATKRRIFYCKYCSYGNPITTNLRRHLLRLHSIEANTRTSSTKATAIEKLIHLWNAATDDDTTNQLESLVLKKTLNREISQKALLELIITCNLPLSIVQHPVFHTFCGTLNPKSIEILPTSHSTITSWLNKSYEDQRDIVRKKLQSARTSIHLSVDIWTSPNNYLLVAICGHFIDHDDKLRNILLGLRTTAGHSGENQWDTILPLLQEYGIQQKIGVVVADNSTTNDTLCRTIASYMQDLDVEWNAATQRIRCQGHIINLAIQAFLFQETIDPSVIEIYEARRINGDQSTGEEQAFRMMGVLGKLHNIIAHSRSSATRTALFKEKVGRMIPLDNRTRWNSWFQLLHAALQHISGIDQYVRENLDSLTKDSLTPTDWNALQTTHDFLDVFYQATLKTQGYSARLDKVMETMDVLLTYLEEARTEFKKNKDLTSRIQRCWEKYTKYYQYTDESAYYAAALILIPEYRTQYIKIWWKKEWQQPAFNSV
jgi:hypothetical protein